MLIHSNLWRNALTVGFLTCVIALGSGCSQNAPAPAPPPSEASKTTPAQNQKAAAEMQAFQDKQKK